MPNLPTIRITESIPFQHCGLHYFGPLQYLKDNNEVIKGYGCIFTCFTTRAIHMDLAADMSLSQFSQVIQKFMYIQGTAETIY